jgi:glutathione reductase (NADPH)
MARFDYDLFVIGAGSGGVRAARMAASLGVRTAVAESGPLGGTCVNAGCVPKKLLVHSSEFAASFRDSRGYGWRVGDTAFDWAALIENKDREIERLNGVYQKLLEGAGANIISGRARLADRHTIEIEGNRMTAERIVLATGGRPFKLPIPGAELGITSDEMFHLDRLPRRALITGGGYIAAEFAGILNGLGSEVTLNYRGPLFLRGFDDDVRLALTHAMAERGITLLFDTVIDAIGASDQGLRATTNHGTEIEADIMLCATGRIPNTADLGLDEVGVEVTERGAVVVDEYSRSTVSNIFAIGDVTDRRALTPVAIAEAMALVRTLYQNSPTAVDYDNIPSAVFSQPQLGTVGLTEAEARARGFDVVIYRSTFRPLLNTLSGRTEQTMMKLVVDRATDLVLGVHMVGPDAAEIIQGFAVALKAGATKATFDRTVGIHPTAAEEFVTMREPVTQLSREGAE